MEIFVWGESPHVSNLEFKMATAWMVNELLDERNIQDLFIMIELKEKMKGMRGEVRCHAIDLPQDFHICIETGAGKRRRQLYTLAHELVHVKQLMNGEMTIVSGGRLHWIGQRGRSAHPNFITEPWEEEAYGREHELYRNYEAARRKLLTFSD